MGILFSLGMDPEIGQDGQKQKSSQNGQTGEGETWVFVGTQEDRMQEAIREEVIMRLISLKSDYNGWFSCSNIVLLLKFC